MNSFAVLNRAQPRRLAPHRRNGALANRTRLFVGALMSRPDIHLRTVATMNGQKPVIFMEEAGVPHDLTYIDLSKPAQKAPGNVKR